MLYILTKSVKYLTEDSHMTNYTIDTKRTQFTYLKPEILKLQN